MTDLLLGWVTSVLDQARVPYAVIGAAALAAHGVARSTFDIDLLTTDTAVLGGGLWGAPGVDSEFTVDIRRGDAADPLAGVVRIGGAGDRDVDVVVGQSQWQADAVERARSVLVAGFHLPVVSPADLVLLKLYAGGVQDLWDIEQLLTVSDRTRLIAEVDTRLDVLPADARRAWVRIVG